MNPNNKLMRLLALNRSSAREYKVVDVASDGGNEASVFLYDIIGLDFWTGGGVTAKQFGADLRALGSKTLHLHINSPGGDVFEGRAMVAAMQAYPGKIVAHVDGLAASAASFLAMHADEITMTDGSFMMIHNGWTLAMGDRHTMAEVGAFLEKIDGTIVDDYMTRATVTREQVAAWMDEEKWFTAAEAVDVGLANSVAPSRSAGANARARASSWNLTAFDHPPAALADAVEPQAAPVPAIAPVTEPDHEGDHAARLRNVRLIENQLA